MKTEFSAFQLHIGGSIYEAEMVIIACWRFVMHIQCDNMTYCLHVKLFRKLGWPFVVSLEMISDSWPVLVGVV